MDFVWSRTYGIVLDYTTRAFCQDMGYQVERRVFVHFQGYFLLCFLVDSRGSFVFALFLSLFYFTPGRSGDHPSGAPRRDVFIHGRYLPRRCQGGPQLRFQPDPCFPALIARAILLSPS